MAINSVHKEYIRYQFMKSLSAPTGPRFQMIKQSVIIQGGRSIFKDQFKPFRVY